MVDDVFGIVGSLIGGAFRVDAVVAEGGFAVVYRAHHTGFRAPVALKCLKVPQQLDTARRAAFLEQFRAEAETLFRLSASISTVVRPLHVDAFNGGAGEFVPFMALEWLDGETLDAIIRRRGEDGLPAFGLDELIELLQPVAEALDRAHHFSGPDGPLAIVHRDIKPENIFVAQVHGRRVVKILDYGIAKAKSVASQIAGRASQTGGSFASFTPAYGAPEQWLPKRFGQTGPWTDVWGLALSLVEALAGRPVIDGDHTAMMGTALDASRRPTPRTEGVVVGDAVEEVFARALALDPRERQRDAGEFWRELTDAASNTGARAAASNGASASASETLLEPALLAESAPASFDLDLDPAELPVSQRRPAISTRSIASPAVEPQLVVVQTETAAAPPPVVLSDGPVSRASVPASARPRVSVVAPPRTLLRELMPSAVLVGSSIVATVVDQVYAANTGELLSIGPLRASWIAGLLLLVGLGHGALRLVARRG